MRLKQSSDSKVRQHVSLQVQTKYLMGVVSMGVPCLTERRGEKASVSASECKLSKGYHSNEQDVLQVREHSLAGTRTLT